MKRLAVTILMLVYLTATTGATVTMHYCMGELKSRKLWQGTEKKKDCSFCGMYAKKGCCEDKQQTIRLDKQHNVPVSNFALFHIFSVSQPLFDWGLVSCFSAELPHFSNKAKSPPGFSLLPLFKKNCTYRI